MTAALVGAASCARCGADLEQSAALCPSCGALLLPAAPGRVLGTSTALLAGVVRASAVRRYLALALDGIPVLVGIAIVVVLATREAYGWLVLTVLATVGYVGISLALMGHRGRSLGRFVCGLRTVDDLTGTPVSVRRLIRRITALHSAPRTVTAVLAAGRDPLDLAPAALLSTELAEGSAAESAVFAPTAAREAPRTTSTDAVALVFDTGRRHVLRGSVLVGRSPENSRGLTPRGARLPAVDHPVLALADLSRTLSKTHALLEWSGSVLWVTDLHSANGSLLVSPDGDRRPLVPGIRGAAAVGWTVQCGSRSFTVQAAADVPSRLPRQATP
jgi:uncharacterized RDD family membrane protein YckC